MTSSIQQKEIEYPDTDGLPMAESDFQREYLTQLVQILRGYFQTRNDVYVSGNLFIYYEQGNPQKVVAPDVFVVRGISNHDRFSYKVWEEQNKLPDFVLEITSKSTVSEDQGVKRGLYAFLGVREYFLYDPTGDYLDPKLKGFRLVEGNYIPMAATVLSDGTRGITSEVLQLELRLLPGGELRLYDPATGKILLNYREAEQARLQAELQAEQAKLQAELQAEQAKLQAELQAEQAKLQAVPRLLEFGLSVEQVAAALSLSVEEVRQATQE